MTNLYTEKVMKCGYFWHKFDSSIPAAQIVINGIWHDVADIVRLFDTSFPETRQVTAYRVICYDGISLDFYPDEDVHIRIDSDQDSDDE